MNFHAKTPLSRTGDQQVTIGICALWLLVNGLLLWKNGIVTTGEADKYLYQAHLLVSTGSLGSANFRWYIIPIALLSLCIRLHLSFAWMVALQLALNGFATVVFYRTTAVLFPGSKAPFIGTMLLLLNLPYQAYNSFLQTESIFQSVSLLLVCLMAGAKKPTGRRLVSMLFALLILSATRPNGLLYWPVVWVFLCFTMPQRRPAWIKLSFAGVGFVICIVLLNSAMGSGGELDFILPFREQHIICGVPTIFIPGEAHTAPGDNSILGLGGYIFHHFGLFGRLAMLKSLYFWGLCRDYFSKVHNWYLAIFFYPPAVAALIALPGWRRYRPVSLFSLLAPVLLTWTMVVLTCDDWQNRIYLGISPFILMLALPLLTADGRGVSKGGSGQSHS